MRVFLLIIVATLLLGAGAYWSFRRFGGPGASGVLGIILIVILVIWLLGGLPFNH